IVANHLLGGSSTGRVPLRVREKEGLSYSTYTTFSSSSLDESSAFRVAAIFAPQNRARVERAIREELGRAVKDGFTAEEVEAAKVSVLEQLRLGHRLREQDRRAHPRPDQRGAAQAHRPGAPVGRRRRRPQEIGTYPIFSSAGP